LSDSSGEIRKSYSEIIRKDATAVILISGLFYLFSFFVQRSFLMRFGVDEVFVELDASILAFSAAAASASFIVLYHIFISIPYSMASRIFLASFNHRIELFLLAVGVAIILHSGFNWLSIFFLFAFVVTSFFSLVALTIARREGQTYTQWTSNNIKFTVEFQDRTVEGYINRKLGQNAWIALVISVLLPYSLGSMIGWAYAERKREFSVVEWNETTNVVISRFSGGLVIAEFAATPDHPHVFLLTGDVRWLNSDAVSSLVFRGTRFPTGIKQQSELRERTTFVEFINQSILRRTGNGYPEAAEDSDEMNIDNEDRPR